MASNDKRLGLWYQPIDSQSNDVLNSKKRRIGDNSSTLVMDMKDMIITNFSQLYLSPKLSDFTIKVEDECIACHKSILGSQSDFFDRLFDSQMLESTQTEVELKETDPRLFRLLLKLTYFGRLDLQELPPQDVIKLFGLIQRYQFNRFEAPFLAKIKSLLNASNVWLFLETSLETHLTDCHNLCLEFLDTISNINQISEDFFDICVESLITFLTRDSLSLSEVDLFLLAKKYVDINEVDVKTREELVQSIRFSLIKYEDLINIVSNSGLVSEQQLWQTMKDKAVIDNSNKSSAETQKNRALVIHNTNLCSDQFCFQVMTGRIGDLEAEEQSNTSSETSMDNEWPIVCKFGFPFNVNHIEMKMSDKRGDRFSYKIQYSAEGLKWKTLYDYSSYTTANYQKLYFESIVAQQFRICGTHQLRMDATTKLKFNSIESFACFYCKKQIKVERIDGFLSNPYWIRNCVQQRVYHDSNNSVVGNQDMKYYSRLMSSNKPIIVALDQPVMIDSFEFHLWDRDDRAYSYVVEVKDGNDWIKLADKSQDMCRSLQTISFSRRPISLVRVKALKIHFVDCNQFRIIKFNFPKTS